MRAVAPQLQPEDEFAASREQFTQMEAFLMSDEAHSKTHSELERELEQQGRELLRRLFGTLLQARPQPFVLRRRSLPFLPLWLRSQDPHHLLRPPNLRRDGVHRRDRRHPLGVALFALAQPLQQLVLARFRPLARIASRRSSPRSTTPLPSTEIGKIDPDSLGANAPACRS